MITLIVVLIVLGLAIYYYSKSTGKTLDIVNTLETEANTVVTKVETLVNTTTTPSENT